MTDLERERAPLPTLHTGCLDSGSVGFATYGTDRELTCYLRALEHMRNGRLVVVLALSPHRPPPAPLPTRVRLIQTAEAGAFATEQLVGWFVPDPVLAVRVALAGLEPGDGLILLFPADWDGEPPESLVQAARRDARPNPVS